MLKLLLGFTFLVLLVVAGVGVWRQFTEHDIVEESLFGFIFGSLCVLSFMFGNAIGYVIRAWNR